MSSFQLKAQVRRYVHTYVYYNGQTSTDYRKMPLYLRVGEKGGREGGGCMGETFLHESPGFLWICPFDVSQS